MKKAGDVKDASKSCGAGVSGVVVETQLFERKNVAIRAEEKKKIRELQSNARRERVELMTKRNDLLIAQMLNENSGGIRDIASNKTVVKAKTLLTKKRINSLDFESLSLKSPWVINPINWNNVLKIWRNYNRNLKQFEDKLEKEILNLELEMSCSKV